MNEKKSWKKSSRNKVARWKIYTLKKSANTRTYATRKLTFHSLETNYS